MEEALAAMAAPTAPTANPTTTPNTPTVPTAIAAALLTPQQLLPPLDMLHLHQHASTAYLPTIAPTNANPTDADLAHGAIPGMAITDALPAWFHFPPPLDEAYTTGTAYALEETWTMPCHDGCEYYLRPFIQYVHQPDTPYPKGMTFWGMCVITYRSSHMQMRPACELHRC